MDIEKALTQYSCRDVANPNYNWNGKDPWIKGMSEDEGCVYYRQTVLGRARSIDDLGKIWLDDSVGALLHALEDNGQLENTIFLFQEDHGVDAKGSLYEGGVRIPQFVHYPNGIEAGSTFDGIVGTVDIAATMLEFAGIAPPYELDGKSWKDAIRNPSKETHWKFSRCLFFEMQSDRAVRCGCYKLLNIHDPNWSTTFTRGRQRGLDNTPYGVVFDLCHGSGDYITNNRNNRERFGAAHGSENLKNALRTTLNCHTENSHPFRAMDYSECASPFNALPTTNPSVGPETADPTATPTATPTGTPTATPTAAPTTIDTFGTPAPTPVRCQDSPLKVKKLLTCDRVVRDDNCGVRRYWSHCRASCGKCHKCIDSKQTLKLDSKVKITFSKNNAIVSKRKKSLKCKKVRDAINKSDLCNNHSDIAVSCPKTCGGC
mmetsp:Transcript_86196/g.175040  ORF Transcript_86196/g.175040 Transcript_86196/m.175040 type:complete len:431 (-) Transcript_86196:1271-2563(-)